MPTHPCKQSVDAQIVAEILKEAAEPRLAASVKEALEKENPAPVAQETLGGNRGENQSRESSDTSAKPSSVNSSQVPSEKSLGQQEALTSITR